MNKKLLSFVVLSANLLISRPPALPNFTFVGNVCYLNSALQSLYSLEPFVNVLRNKASLFKPNTLPYEYVELVTNFKNPLTINPKTSMPYIESFQKINDAVMQQVARCGAEAQNDSQEFLTKLFDELQTRNNFIAPQGEDTSIFLSSFDSLFFNKQQTIVQCPNLNEKKDEYYSPIFSIPIQDSPNAIKLENLLKNYFAPEVLEDFRGYPKNSCTKQLQLITTPEILILHTLRLAFGFKIETPLEVPEFLNLLPITNHNEKYQLTAVIVHKGSAYGGHYIAYVRDFEDKQWYKCDDSSISGPLAFSSIKEIQQGYMFFYQKIKQTTPASQPTRPQTATAPQQPSTSPIATPKPVITPTPQKPQQQPTPITPRPSPIPVPIPPVISSGNAGQTPRITVPTKPQTTPLQKALSDLSTEFNKLTNKIKKP